MTTEQLTARIAELNTEAGQLAGQIAMLETAVLDEVRRMTLVGLAQSQHLLKLGAQLVQVNNEWEGICKLRTSTRKALAECPACAGSGYEAVAEDEVAPCTHPDHQEAVVRAAAEVAALEQSLERAEADGDREKASQTYIALIASRARLAEAQGAQHAAL
jgi:hypothetical protein